MNTMKKSKISVLLCGLAMMLVMYNCKKNETFPTEPDKDLVNAIKDIKVATVTIDPPAPVTTTAATAEASAKATAVNGALDGIAASGVVPASVTAAGAEVSAALPAADIATLAAVTSQTIADIAAGGAPSPALQAIMDKVAASPALQAYLPKFTLPTVGGKTISGRMGLVKESDKIITTDKISGVEAVLVDDACVLSAAATYSTVKASLDAGKKSQDDAVLAAYTLATTPLTTSETTCKTKVTTDFTAYRAAIDTQVKAALEDLAAAKTVLGDLYNVLTALVNIQAIGAYDGLNDLEKASTAACSATTTATVASAATARDANLLKVKNAYDTALAAADAARVKLVESCHNQGGGQ